MLPGMEMLGCQIDVPASVMQHVVKVESSFNPFAIGVVRGRLARQPRTLEEAVATAKMLEDKGFNFSLGLAQVNRYNLKKYGIDSYAQAFEKCTNLKAGSRILLACNQRAGGHWGKSFSCYYSGNFTTGYRQGYVQKIERSMFAQSPPTAEGAIPVIADTRAAQKTGGPRKRVKATVMPATASRASESIVSRRSVATTPAEAPTDGQPSIAESKAPVDAAFVF